MSKIIIVDDSNTMRQQVRQALAPTGITLVEAVDEAVRLRRLAKAKREALEMLGESSKLIGDRAGLVVRPHQAHERHLVRALREQVVERAKIGGSGDSRVGG